MPTPEDMEKITPPDEPTTSEEAPPQPPPPQPVAIDASNLRAEIATGIKEAVREMLALAQQQQAATAVEKEEPIEDEEWTTAPDTAIKKAVHNAILPLKREIETFRSFGLGKLSDLTRHVASSTLPYYSKYKAEIEARLNSLDAVSRADTNVIKLVHDTVVAEHIDEIRQAAREEERRTLLQSANSPTPGSNNGRTKGSNEPSVPTPEDLGFTEEQIQMIEDRGGPDAFARRVSNGRFSSWAEYAKARASMTAVPRKSGRLVIPFRRANEKT